MFINKFLGISS